LKLVVPSAAQHTHPNTLTSPLTPGTRQCHVTDEAPSHASMTPGPLLSTWRQL
jgi:hypothetical protein